MVGPAMSGRMPPGVVVEPLAIEEIVIGMVDVELDLARPRNGLIVESGRHYCRPRRHPRRAGTSRRRIRVVCPDVAPLFTGASDSTAGIFTPCRVMRSVTPITHSAPRECPIRPVRVKSIVP